MLKIVLTIVAVLAIAVIGVLVLAATKPDTFRVTRTTTIKAPADRIFPLINDYRQWALWSPWETMDPQMTRTYSAVTVGKGATYAWEGNSSVGAGNMTIMDSAPPSMVAIRLNMIKPMAASNDVTFTLVPQADGTNVTWAMQGEVPYFAKIFHVFMDMDKMLGGNMESGFAKLKAAAEK